MCTHICVPAFEHDTLLASGFTVGVGAVAQTVNSLTKHGAEQWVGHILIHYQYPHIEGTISTLTLLALYTMVAPASL